MIKRLLFFIIPAVVSFHVALSQELRGKLIPPPGECEKGYEKGVSSQFYGFLEDKLIVAGGANFPNVPAAEGGPKAYYKGIYTLENDRWFKIGELNEATAYESFVEVKGLNMLITNALQKYPPANKVLLDTIKINYDSGLPKRIEQPIVVSDSGYIYIWGGFSLPSDVPVGGWRIDAKSGEVSRIAAPPAKNLTGAVAVPYKHGFLIVGGINHDIFEAALIRREKMKSAQGEELRRLKRADSLYMAMSPVEYKFNDKLLFYDPETDTWKSLGHSPHLARAGAAAAIDRKGRLIVTGGELKPGIRNPQTWILADIPWKW